MLAVELVAAGLIVVLVVALARLAWVISRRSEGESITEAQARENAAPLTKAIWRRPSWADRSTATVSSSPGCWVNSLTGPRTGETSPAKIGSFSGAA